ncbi:MAG TPA: glucosaminidase domain-containing protein [Paludibacter sp.]|nr:glucosaminidase domain-containing protein [Prolixibacteraceae bacterium]
MLRIIRDLIYFAIVIFAIYLFAKTEKFNSRYWPIEIKIKNVKLIVSDSIINQSDSALIPVNYIGSIDFRSVNPDKRKELFIQHLLPAIIITRERLLDDLHHVEFIETRIGRKKKISYFDSTFIVAMKHKYETDSIIELKRKIYPHPVSLALTQAVLESGWGTSSIFRNGNNIFGIMSFSSDDSRSLIQFQTGDDERYLRTYSSVIESVEHYYLLISKLSSYKRFRQKRWEGEASSELLLYMGSYHESDQYAEMAQSIIASNNLERYDNVAIDPKYEKTLTLKSFLMKY